LLPVYSSQTQFEQYDTSWQLSGATYSAWIRLHPIRHQVPGTEWWYFWAPEFNDWVMMQDTVTGGNDDAWAYYYCLWMNPVFSQVPVLDHYDFVPASDPATSVVFDDGGVDTASASDMASLGIDQGVLDTAAITASAASYAKMTAHCRVPHVNITVAGLGGGSMKFRFCFNEYKHLARFDSQTSPMVTSHTDTIASIYTLGTISDSNDTFTHTPLSYNGYPDGQVHGDASYDINGTIGLGPFGISKTLQTVHWGAYGHYDGSVQKYG
jgi:hypothetical protein